METKTAEIKLYEGLTGNDSMVILNTVRWKSRLEVYEEKRNQVVPEVDSESAKWSLRLRPAIAEEFSERTGLRVWEEEILRTHPEHPFMIGMAQWLCEEDGKVGILDIRTTHEFKRKEWEQGKMPLSHLIRLQHNLVSLGFEFGYLVVLIGGNHMEYRKVNRDELIAAHLITELTRFWECVQNGEMPEIDGKSATSDWIKEQYPIAEENTEIKLPQEAHSLLEEYDHLKAVLEEVEEAFNKVANKLKYYMGSNERGVIGNRLIEWKNSKRTLFDTKRFQAEHPDLYKRYTKESISRRFTVK